MVGLSGLGMPSIMGFQLTPESARSAIAQGNDSLESLAFATIIKNRVNRGGIKLINDHS
jgi:DNA adenine methylase